MADDRARRLGKNEAMTAVTLACPHCAGSIQTDSAYAGQQVACPLCHGALMLPPLEMLVQFATGPAGYPQQPPPYQPQPPYGQHPYQPVGPEVPPTSPPQEQLFTLACPVCGNGLQVTVAMSGQQVGCPYCANPMVVPSLGWQVPQAPLSAPAQTYQPAQPAHEHVDFASLLPPGALPLPLEQPATTTAPVVQQIEPPPETAAPRESSASKRREPSAADRLPPTRAERSPPTVPGADRFPPKRGEASPPANDRFPPGFGGSQTRETKERETAPPPAEAPRNDRLPPSRDRKPVSERTEERNDRLPPPKREAQPEPVGPEVQPTTQSEVPTTTWPDRLKPELQPPPAEPEPSIDSFLPPGAPAAQTSPATLATPPVAPEPTAPSPLDHLLPPGAAEVNTAAVGRTTPLAPQRLVDSLLPAGASSEAASAPGMEVPLPKLQPGPLRPILAPAAAEKKSGLDTHQSKGSEEKVSPEEEMETKRLSAEDRSRRRFRRNAIIWSLCLIILFAVFYFMAR